MFLRPDSDSKNINMYVLDGDWGGFKKLILVRTTLEENRLTF